MSARGGKEGKMSAVTTEGRTKKEICISEVFLLVADCIDKYEQKRKRADVGYPEFPSPLVC